MQKRTIEITVGLFMIVGIIAFLVLALKVSGLTNYTSDRGYYVTASFDNIGGLKVRAPVTIAGVRIGRVVGIDLNPTSYQADVKILISRHFKQIPNDSSASILTAGLLGANYISFSPGYNNKFLHQGSKIDNTHSALILENLIGQLVFNIQKGNKNSNTNGNGSANHTQ